MSEKQHFVQAIENLFAENVIGLLQWLALLWGNVVLCEFECIAPASGNLVRM